MTQKFERKAAGKVAAYVANPAIYPLKLDANESMYPIPTALQEEMAEAVKQEALTVYPDPMAEGVCRKFADICKVKIEQVVAGDGSDELLHVICDSFLEERDKVLTFSPDFSMYGFYAAVKGNQVIEKKKKEDFSLSSQEIIAAYHQEQPKLIFFSNPCNPTGVGLKREEVLEVLQECPEALVIVDEAYMDFWDQSVLDQVGRWENLMVLKTCSKAYSLASLRLGFAIGPEELIQVMKKIKSPYNVSTLTQKLGEIALSHPEYVQENIKNIQKEREHLWNRLSSLAEKTGKLTLYPSCANFIFFSSPLSQEIDGELKKQGIIIRSYGNAFLRISIGTREQMERVAEVIQKIAEGGTQ